MKIKHKIDILIEYENDGTIKKITAYDADKVYGNEGPEAAYALACNPDYTTREHDHDCYDEYTDYRDEYIALGMPYFYLFEDIEVDVEIPDIGA